MRYALLLVADVAWALWFGGTIATFVFGLHDFHALPRATAGDAANAMFVVFGPYELVLAAAGLAAAGLLMVTYPTKGTVALVALFIAAGAMAITFALGLIPIMEGLRAQGMAGSPQFMRLHGQSMMTMSIQAVVLLGTGALLLALSGGRPATPLTTADRFDAASSAA